MMGSRPWGVVRGECGIIDLEFIIPMQPDRNDGESSVGECGIIDLDLIIPMQAETI